MSNFALLRNTVTGVKFMVDVSAGRYRRLAQGFLNKMKVGRYFVKMITLTQGDESYRPKFLNSFLTNLRIFYGKCPYLWTVEVQEKRFITYGEKVLHFHILVGFPWDHRFTGDDIRRLNSWWSYGSVEVTPAPDRYRSVRYLLKYITKSLSSPLLAEYDIRRVGSSNLPGYLRQSWEKFSAAVEHFQSWGQELSQFVWRYGRAYVVGFDIGTLKKFSHCVYRPPPSDWIFDSVVTEECF